MSHHLDEAWVKVERADHHLQSLEGEVQTVFPNMPPAPPDAITMRLEDHPDISQCLLLVESIPDEHFLRWGTIVGDFVQNLRSALDYLAWQLVLTGPRLKPPKWKPVDVYFPIYDTRSQFRGNCVRRLPGVGIRQLAMIEMEQPYKRYHDIRFSPLRRLRDLSNKDKHRLITPIKLTSGGQPRLRFIAAQDCEIAGELIHTYVPYEPGAEIARVWYRVQGSEPKVRVEGDLVFHVAFDDGAWAGLHLGAMHGAVTHILKTFEPFFDSLP